MATLADTLDELTTKGDLSQSLKDGAVRCLACGHRCLIRPGRRGICRVRYNRDGDLRVPWGYVAAIHADPIEKKPFFHFLPGSRALTFGMLGCDLHCPYCQNWVTSQALRDPLADAYIGDIQRITPQDVVRAALRSGCDSVVSSYNEPLISSEWAAAIFKEARAAGLLCGYVSNGNNTPEVMDYLQPYLHAYKVDLKCMSESKYRTLGSTLRNTLDGIRRAHAMGIWVEVVTLVVPGFNDSNEDLWDAARTLAGISRDIPWHVTAFHKDYRMTKPDDTRPETLVRAAEIGREAGLRFVYSGNLPGQTGDYEDTLCPECGGRLIRRTGYTVSKVRIAAGGTCPDCGTHVPGLWNLADAAGLPTP